MKTTMGRTELWMTIGAEAGRHDLLSAGPVLFMLGSGGSPVTYAIGVSRGDQSEAGFPKMLDVLFDDVGEIPKGNGDEELLVKRRLRCCLSVRVDGVTGGDAAVRVDVCESEGRA